MKLAQIAEPQLPPVPPYTPAQLTEQMDTWSDLVLNNDRRLDQLSDATVKAVKELALRDGDLEAQTQYLAAKQADLEAKLEVTLLCISEHQQILAALQRQNEELSRRVSFLVDRQHGFVRQRSNN